MSEPNMNDMINVYELRTTDGRCMMTDELPKLLEDVNMHFTNNEICNLSIACDKMSRGEYESYEDFEGW